jgi:hypothetical protein
MTVIRSAKRSYRTNDGSISSSVLPLGSYGIELKLVGDYDSVSFKLDRISEQWKEHVANRAPIRY